MSTHMRWLAIPALLAAGCAAVKTEHPVSDRPEALDKARLEGVWLVEEEILHLRFDDGNVGRLAALEWEDGGFRARRWEFVVAHAGDGRYVSLREEGEEQYDLFAYDFAENGDLVVHSEPTDAFARAVEAGRLRGEVRKDGESTEVVLASPPDTLVSFLSSAAPDALFGDSAFVLKRLPAPGGAE